MGKKRTRSRVERNRRAPHQKKSALPLIIIVGEGQTEDQYVRALARHRYDGLIALKPFKQRGNSTGRRTDLKSLVGKAVEAEKANPTAHGIWIICDRDRNEAHRTVLDSWCAASGNGRKSVHHGISMNVPEFEYWLLLHFVSDPKCNAVREAEKRLRNDHVPNYEKGQEISATIIEAVNTACANAKQANATSVASAGGTNDCWSIGRWTGMPDLIAYCDSVT